MKKRSTPATPGNQNFRAQIIYKSGASQEFLAVTPSTTIHQKLRDAFYRHLSDPTAPDHGNYVVRLVSGSLSIRWTDVSSVHIWVD